MLRILRKKGVMKKLLWVVAILIILSLGILGTAGYLSDSGFTQPAGKIFGKSISIKEYQKAYADVKDQALMIHGDNLNEMLPYLDLESEAWDRLILLHAANRENIKVTDEEVIDYLKPSPMFHREGKFDKYLYEEIVKFIFKRSTRDFEEGIRNQLKINKLIASLTENLSITDEKLREAYKKEHERVKVSYVLFSPDDYLSGIETTDEELEHFFNQNTAEFQVPPSVNVEYVTFPFHEDMMDAQKEALTEVIENTVFPDLDSGEKKLKDVAAGSNLKIEETGFFNNEQPIASLGWSLIHLDKIFNAKKNDFIGPIVTDKGVQVLRIKEERAAYTPKFADAKPKVLEFVLNQKSMALTKQKAEDFLNQYKSTSDTTLKKYAEANSIPVEETPFFALGDYLPNIGISNDFQTTALELNKENPVSTPVKTAKGFAIIEFVDIEKMDEEKFVEEKDAFKQQWLNQERLKTVTEYLKNLRDNADLKINRAR